MHEAHRLADNVIIVSKNFDAETLAVTESLWSEIDDRFGDFSGRTLISAFSFDEDWPTWEVHPAGDEIVYLLSGAVNMVLALPEGDRSIKLDEPGHFVIVPRNTWHTARINVPTSMLFITPGEGTLNAEQPDRGAE